MQWLLWPVLFLYVALVVTPFAVRGTYRAGKVIASLARRREQSGETTVENPDIIVTLVHGTWARRAAWTSEGSPIRKLLEDFFIDRQQRIQFVRFEWSGFNSFGARRRAAESLREQFSAIVKDQPRAQHFLVAHSHGGNIALEASDALPPNLLGGIICLATPVLIVHRKAFDNLTSRLLPWIGLPLAMALFLVWQREELAGIGLWGVLAAGLVTVWLVRFLAPKIPETSHARIPTGKVAFFRLSGDEASLIIGASNLVTLVLERAVSAPFRAISTIVSALDDYRDRKTEAGEGTKTVVRIFFTMVGGGVLLSVIGSAENYLPAILASLLLLVAIGAFAGGLLLWWVLPLIFMRAHYVIYLFVPILAVALLPLLLFSAPILGLVMGPEIAFAVLSLQVTAEVCPVGRWTVINVASGFSGSSSVLRHSLIYEDKAALDEIRNWLGHRLRPRLG